MTTYTKHAGVTATAGTGPKLTTLKNLVNNPRAVNGTGIAGSSGTGGVAALSRPTTGGPLADAPSFARLTWTTAPTSNNSEQLYNGVSGQNPVTAGKTYILRAYTRTSFASKISPKFGYYLGGTYVSGYAPATVDLPANTWTAITMEATIPAGVDRVQINTDLTGTALPAVGDTHDASAWFLFEKPASATVDSTLYSDGDSPGWAWLGTAHASASQGYGAIA